MMLSKADIVRGLTSLDAKAKSASKLVDLSVYGGAALAIAFDMRQATRDVDAVVNGSPDFLRAAVAEVAEEEGWPVDWLNDGVKGFRSSAEKMVLMDAFPGGADGGLRVTLPVPEYLFAMKCMAMRPEGIDGSRDISDIMGLAAVCAISTPDQAFDLVEQFYPARLISPKVRFGLEEIMENIAAKSNAPASPPMLGGGLLSPSAPTAPLETPDVEPGDHAGLRATRPTPFKK